MRHLLLGTVCVLAVALSSAASAAGISGTIGGSYANTLSGGGGGLYGVNGSLLGSFDDSWGGEIGANYHNASGGGDIFNIGGSIYYGGSTGRIVGTAQYHDNFGAQFETGGVGGDWFVAPHFTLSAKAGIVSGGGALRGYGGVQGAWYVTRDVALSASFDYMNVGIDVSSATLKGEWLISESTPIALYGGYQHEDVGGTAEVLFVGIKLYTNGNGATTLVDRHRTGSLGYSASSPLFYDNL